MLFFFLPHACIYYTRNKIPSQVREVALCDFLTRRFLEASQKAGADQRTQSGGWSGAKGGEITIDEPGQHILERTSVVVHAGDGGTVEARFTVAMPARGEPVVVVVVTVAAVVTVIFYFFS